MDLTKLTLSDRVIAGSGIALLIFSFLPWFGVKGYGGGGNAWDVGFFTGILPVFLGLICVAYVAIVRFGTNVNLPELPIPWALALLIVAGLAALLILIRLVIGYKVSVPGFSVKLDRKYGLYLSFLASLGLAGGAFLHFREEGGAATTRKGSSGPNTPF